MITVKEITPKRLDVFFKDGTFMGDFTLGQDGNFYWFPRFRSDSCFGADVLLALHSALEQAKTDRAAKLAAKAAEEQP